MASLSRRRGQCVRPVSFHRRGTRVPSGSDRSFFVSDRIPLRFSRGNSENFRECYSNVDEGLKPLLFSVLSFFRRLRVDDCVCYVEMEFYDSVLYWLTMVLCPAIELLYDFPGKLEELRECYSNVDEGLKRLLFAKHLSLIVSLLSGNSSL